MTPTDHAAVTRRWAGRALPVLEAYTRVPCLSPAFDDRWEERGALAEATALLADWCRTLELPGLEVSVHQPPGRTPLLVVTADGGAPGPATLCYGHLDKQPPFGPWDDGLGAFEPVRRGDRLYGRGTADDGYAVLAAGLGLEALAASGRPLGRVVVLIEASEESASPDLGAHLADVADVVGSPGLVLCLDSSCVTWDRLWVTTSLRGALMATVTVEVLTEGVHSGLAGAVVPSSFRLLRQLLDRLEDDRTGTLLLPELVAPVPPARRAEQEALAQAFGDPEFPTVAGLALDGAGPAERQVARAWSPALELIGIDGVPPVAEAGNVLRPATSARLSLRLPPSVDAQRAATALVDALTADPPSGARVDVELEEPAQGWVAPEPTDWVTAALARASVAAFGRPHGASGEGGTIPFLALLGRRFPAAQVVATGVLGPGSNAHGPNEFLDLPMAAAVSGAVAELVTAASASVA